MSSVTIVSGCPGSGKTTLARRIASIAKPGLHLDSDTFYRFPARPIDPKLTEAHQQNTSIMRALSRSAGSFAEDGYAVVIYGVIGPRFLPVLVRELPPEIPFEYVVLRVELDRALARVRQREGSGASATVAHMHRAFSELGVFARCVIDTSLLTEREVVSAFLAGREKGTFVVSRDSVLG